MVLRNEHPRLDVPDLAVRTVRQSLQRVQPLKELCFSTSVRRMRW